MYLHIAHLIWTPKDELWGILNDDSKKVRLIDATNVVKQSSIDDTGDYPCNIVKYYNQIYLCISEIALKKNMSPTDDFPISEFTTADSSYAYILAFGYMPN